MDKSMQNSSNIHVQAIVIIIFFLNHHQTELEEITHIDR